MPYTNTPYPERVERPLTISTLWVGRRAVVRVDGEIDIATQGPLEAALGAAVDAGALELWVDLTDVGFMDSTGLNALLALRTRTRALRRTLVVISPEGPARRTLQLAGLEDLLPLYASRGEAQRGV